MIDPINPRESAEIDKVTCQLLGTRSKDCRFEMLDQGQVSYVYRVSAEEASKREKKTIILKIRGGTLRRFPDISTEMDATKNEFDTITYLSKRWFGQVPRVLYIDQFQQLMALQDFGETGKLLHDVLAAGPSKPNFLIGLMHSAFQVSFSLQEVDISDLFSYKVLSQRFKEKVRLLTELSESYSVRCTLSEMMREHRKDVLLHGDMCPKNIFLLQTQWGLIDFDSLAIGDEAFDACYFLAHLFLYEPFTLQHLSVEEFCGALSQAFPGSTLNNNGFALLIKAVLEFRLAESHGISFSLTVSNARRRRAIDALRSNEKNPSQAIRECLNELVKTSTTSKV